jgi:hypothetical protein
MPLPVRASGPPRGAAPNRTTQFVIPRFVGDATEEDDEGAFCGMFFPLSVLYLRMSRYCWIRIMIRITWSQALE